MKNRVTKPTNDRSVTKASDLKVGQLVFVKDCCNDPFNPAYTFDHRIAAIVNKNTVLLTTPGGKEKRCNIHHIKPMSWQSHQQVPSNSFEIVFRRIQWAYSKVTSIIFVQEKTSCSKAPFTQVSNFNNFTLISISTHLLQD